ncbi:MAG TPA: VOC family protein [Chloroflexota bacterium]|nr:VOC family protein [Chloroflexota bacterium]
MTTHIWPTFKYRNARAAIRFLHDAFGFEEVAVYAGDTEDEVAHAELRWPEGGGVMLGSARNGDAPVGSVYVVTSDVDTLHERAQRAGAEIVYPLRDEDYGNHTFTARDPEGVTWSFGTYAGENG